MMRRPFNRAARPAAGALRSGLYGPGGLLPVVAVAAVLVLLPIRWNSARGTVPAVPVSGISEDETLLEAGLRALREGNSPLAVTLIRASGSEESGLTPEAWLGLGVAYARMERWNAALDAFDRSAGSRPGPLSDWILFLRADLLARSGRSEASDSLVAFHQPAAGDGPAAQRIRRMQLELARAAGDSGRTVEILEDLIARREGNAAGHALALSRMLASEDSARSRGLLEQVLDLPGNDEPKGEAARLLIERGAGDPEFLLDAGAVLSSLAEWEEAIRALRAAHEAATEPATRMAAGYRMGIALFRSRRFREAREVLAGISGRYGTSAAFYHAQAVAATSSREEAAAAYVAVADRFPQSRWAPRALRLAAERLGADDCGRSREVLNRLIQDYPTHWENAEALFQMGNCARRQGDLEEAQTWYMRLGSGVYHPYEKAQGYYWAARMATARGDTASAGTYLRRTADRYPDTYYGALAAADLGWPLRRPLQEPRWQIEGALTVPEWATPDLAAGVVLLRVGLEEEGETQLLHAVGGAGRDRERLYELWEACVAGGANNAAARLGEQLLNRYQWPEEDPRYRNLAYPLYYLEQVVSEARPRSLDPFLVMALMRQESLYRSNARSYAGARGLMQLMPETANDWAQRLRLPPVQPEDLYDPDLNIRLGTPYLARLIEQFDGSVEKALAAYNAGATNVRRWERRLEDERPETFVESIGFEQTRAYVRTVLNHYYRYLDLWTEPGT